MRLVRVPAWCWFPALALAAMVVASVQSAPGDWQAAVRWAQQRRTTFVAPDRPSLPSGPLPGDAGAGYADAVRLAGPTPGTCDWWSVLDTSDEPVLSAEHAAALAALAPAFLALGAATQAPRTIAVDAADWFEVRSLATALLVRGRARAEADELAAADVATALACAVDLAAVATPVAHLLAFTLMQSIDQAASDAWLARLTEAARARLAEATALADASLPRVSELPAEIAVQLVEMLADEAELRPEQIGLGSAWFAWRHGFSIVRDGRARACELVAAVREFEAAGGETDPWSVRAPRLRQLVEQERANNRDMQLSYLHGVFEAEEARREAVARLRLLRLALAAHRGLPLPTLADPLGGGSLAVARDAGGLQLGAANGLQRRVRSGR